MSQLKAGAILSYLSLFISIIVSFIYIPILIRFLGQSEYGLYALIGSIAAYFSVMDMGLGNTIIRYNSREIIKGNKIEEAKLNGMFLKLYSIIAFLTIIIGVFIYKNTEVLFQGSLTVLEIDKAKIMIIILTINFALSFPLSIFSSIIQAYEKFVVSKTISIIRTVSIPLCSVPFLMLDYGAVTIVLLTCIINISVLLFNLIYSFKVLGVRIIFVKMDGNLLKEIWGYSFFVFLGVIVDQIYWNTGQLVLGVVAGTSLVAIYAVAMQIINLYKNLSTSISGLFLPKVSKMVAENVSNSDITKNMIKFGRIQFYIIMLFISLYTIYGKQFLEIWVGDEYSQAYYISLIILFPLTIPLIQNFGISILYAKNMQKFRSVVLITIAIINLVLSFYLAGLYGGMGVAISTSLSLFLGNILVMNIYYHKYVGINIIEFWQSLYKIIVPLVIYFLVFILISNLFTSSTLGSIITIITYVALYFIIIYNICFNNYEKNLFYSMIKKVPYLRRN